MVLKKKVLLWSVVVVLVLLGTLFSNQNIHNAKRDASFFRVGSPQGFSPQKKKNSAVSSTRKATDDPPLPPDTATSAPAATSFLLWQGNATRPCSGCVQAQPFHIRHCETPKTSSTNVMNLYLRLNNITHELLGHGGSRQIPKSTGSATEAQTLAQWTAVTVYREPHERLLSAYLDTNTYRACQGKSFEQFITQLPENPQWLRNPHFAIQSNLCPLATVNQLIDYAHMAEGMKHVLQQVGAWETVGRTGWGINGTQAFMDVPLYAGLDVPGKVHDILPVFYTADMWNIVSTLYADDMQWFPAFIAPPDTVTSTLQQGNFTNIQDYLLRTGACQAWLDNPTRAPCGCYERLVLRGWNVTT